MVAVAARSRNLGERKIVSKNISAKSRARDPMWSAMAVAKREAAP